MSVTTTSPEFYEMLADHFRVLSEPARLRIVYTLRRRELTVGEVVTRTGFGQANVSKHLQVLHALGFVKRRKNGLHVHYALADRQVLKLCDLMSGRLKNQVEAQQLLMQG
jgi:DNA-binding transcriptional ArsR family regulator